MVVARPKQESKLLEFAERRLNAMTSIDPNLDFGDDISIKNFSELIEESQNQLETYNETIASLEQLIIEMAENEKAIVELAKRLLDAIAARKGRKSSDFKLVNSVRLYPLKIRSPKKDEAPPSQNTATQNNAVNSSSNQSAMKGTMPTNGTASTNGTLSKQEPQLTANL